MILCFEDLKGRIAGEKGLQPGSVQSLLPTPRRFSGRQRRGVDDGFTLIITILISAVALLIFARMFSWAFSNAKVTQRNNQYNMSECAAEGAVERVVAQMDRDFIALTYSNASAYTGLPATIDQSGWPVHYTFSDTNGNANMASVYFGPPASSTTPLNSQYAGLYGLAQDVDVYATATPIGQSYSVPASVHEALQLATVPLFQFAIFYNVNLEIDPGAPMTITGPVFCNQNIWEGSDVCTFSSFVTAVGTNAIQTANPFASSYTGSGRPTFQVSGQPVGHGNSLIMPIGTNNSPGAILGMLNLPPSDYSMGTAAAYSSQGILYPANAADLVITNFASGTNDGSHTPTGTNLIVYLQDSGLSQIPYDFFIATNRSSHKVYITNYVPPAAASNIVFAGYSWITNAVFYDWREGWNGGSGPPKRVEAVQIDVGALNQWLTNSHAVYSGYDSDRTKVLHSSHHIDSVYVYTSVPLSNKVLPAVRVMNGAQLPSPGGSTAGFTVATPFPVYVWGNYNSKTSAGSSLGLNSTTYTLPAALMADSVTVLSTSWSDSNTNRLPSPGNTTVNAAMLEGIVQSDPTISGDYSGGLENFMRLLESWGGTLTYNGSIVVLFYSQYATNHWRPTGNYYNAPTRKWAFDTNFKQASKLPPLTPSLKAMIRGQWYGFK